LQPRLGLIVSVFGLIPVLLTGWFLGKRGGFIAGGAMLVVNMVLKIFVTDDWDHLTTISDYMGSLMIMLLGIGVGHTRDMQNRLTEELIERKRAQKEIRNLSEVVEQGSTPLFITDIEGTITYVNAAFLEVSGFNKADVFGKNPRMFKSGLMSKDYYEGLWKTILGGENFDVVVPNKRTDGQIWYYDQTIHPLKDESGQVTHFVSTGKDISAQIKAEHALQASEKRFRSLFENSPIALWEQDFSAVKQALDAIKGSSSPDLDT